MIMIMIIMMIYWLKMKGKMQGERLEVWSSVNAVYWGGREELYFDLNSYLWIF